ncbi:RnfABCDGE type electron transport complex subunit D [Tissierella creatinini]|nr:RnfABCDGE type electron transport complex subunit D [Tissierella creatinini]TJX63626.1 RnfABCDGE type electron transport complex subunit D [Soehngenia saccharolytica]
MEDNKSASLQLDDMLTVSQFPHVRSSRTVKSIMLDVIIALIPAMIGSIYFYGINAVKLILVTVVSAVLFEFGIQRLLKKEVRIGDLSAVVTGILLAFNLPGQTPWWVAVFGAGFAIIIVKELFGGIGSNFMNPALAARAALLMSWPGIMSVYIHPDGVSGATPLAILKGAEGTLPTIQQMLIGDIGGSIGETSAILLLIGAAYLIIKKVIDWKIPVIYIVTTAIMLSLLGVDGGNLLYHILGGGLILGAFFMATDYSSTPVTPMGRIIFAVGCGLLTALIRVKGGMPEGVSYSILIMNVATPVIEKWTKPRVFGEVKKNESNR